MSLINLLSFRYIQRVVFLLAMLLSGLSMGLCQHTDLNNPDSLFHVADKLAKTKQYTECRALCFKVLGDFPNYRDFAILAARTLAWENEFDSARQVLSHFNSYEIKDVETYLLLADINIWQRMYDSALIIVEDGLNQHSNDSLLLQKRIDILNLIEQSKTPNAYQTIYTDTNEVAVNYYFDFFSKPYLARRHILSSHYSRITSITPLTIRINIGDQVLNNESLGQGLSGQIELDAYPNLGEKSYLYLNYGISKGNFFPAHRAGIEYYRGFKYGIESSLGARYMYWNTSKYFLTASIVKYLKQYWISLRPFWAVLNESNTYSIILEGRKYYSIFNNYIFIQSIYGDSPDQPAVLVDELGKFQSIKAIIGIKHRSNSIRYNASFGIQREEYLPLENRIRIDIRIGAAYVF